MITRATFCFATPKKRYSVGDTRKRGNTTYVKQIKYTRDPAYGICQESRRGKTLCEGVVKGSIRDQKHPEWKP